MARLARVVAVDVPHHITQRGNARRFILQDEPDRTVYFELLQEYTAQYQVAVIGYCLMSNHVHLVAVPSRAEVLARALKETHGRFASYWNARHNSNGHVWQDRYYSCPLDNTHLWEALRYTEMNPVRASLVEKAEQWSWSSASAHCGVEPAGEWMAMDLWASHWSPGDWRSYLDVGTSGSTLTAIAEARSAVGRWVLRSSPARWRQRRNAASHPRKGDLSEEQMASLRRHFCSTRNSF